MLTVASVTWFLIRVIPNPMRASYPCQQAAFPMASAFVMSLLSLRSRLLKWLRGIGSLAGRTKFRKEKNEDIAC